MNNQKIKGVVIDRKVMLGKPVIAGTRITVDQILKWLAAGETQETILKEYPYLAAEKIEAAIQFAADTFDNQEYHYSLSA